jgi:hypothetical protein
MDFLANVVDHIGKKDPRGIRVATIREDSL